MTDVERLREELKRDIRRWQVRRRIAVSAFILVVFIAMFYMISPIYLPVEAIVKLREFNSIIISIVGLCSSIVLLYIGAATYSDAQGNKVTT